MSLAIVPGSFDPMTLGHLDIVREASERYDEVVVALMINPQKQYLLDTATRLRVAEVTVSELENVRVIFDGGMLIDLFDRLHADAVCKGWRNETDYRYETEMAEWNRSHNPRFYTELIQAKREREEISSTAVRTFLEKGTLPEGWVHPQAAELLKDYLHREEKV